MSQHKKQPPKPAPKKPKKSKSKPNPPPQPSPLQAFPYGPDGWGELFEGVTDADLRSAAVSPHAVFDVAAQARAYQAVGLPAAAEALRGLQARTCPRIVHAPEFQRALDRCVGAITHLTLRAEPRAHLAFAVTPGAPKSNLWIFLQLMRGVRGALGAAGWRVAAQHVWLVMPLRTGPRAAAGHTAGTGLRGLGAGGRAVHLVLADDCVYSGSQLASLAREVVRALRPAAVLCCPAFSTMRGLHRVMDSTQGAVYWGGDGGSGGDVGSGGEGETKVAPPVSVCIGTVVGYPSGAAQGVMREDVALCLQAETHRAQWVMVPLAGLLGLGRYAWRWCRRGSCDEGHMWDDDCDDSSVYGMFQGKSMAVRFTLVGEAPVAFDHKLADRVSVPTTWFMLGPTLRRALDALCASPVCPLLQKHAGGGGRLRVRTAPMHALMEQLDAQFVRLRDGGDSRDKGLGAVQRAVRLPRMWTSQSLGLEAALVCSDAVMSAALDAAGAQPSALVDLSRMPAFVPLLTPSVACGAAFDTAVIQAANRGDWLAELSAEDASWNTSGPKDDEADSEGSGPTWPLAVCVDAPYKRQLRQRIAALQRVGKVPRAGRGTRRQLTRNSWERKVLADSRDKRRCRRTAASAATQAKTAYSRHS